MSKIEAEWGGNVNFVNPSWVNAHDADGNELSFKCKCGKEATFFAIGKEAYLGLCEDCSSLGVENAGQGEKQ